MESRRVRVEGRVQRVGFRDWAVKQAQQLGITGWVRNLSDGAVEILAQGAESAVEAFTEACREGPRFAQVTRVHTSEASDPRVKGFTKRFGG